MTKLQNIFTVFALHAWADGVCFTELPASALPQTSKQTGQSHSAYYRLTKSVRHLRYSYIVSGQLGFQAKIKETLTSISSSLWPFDEDSYFSAFCEMCQTFPFVYTVQDAM